MNDVPASITHVIQIMRELGIEVYVTTTTDAALEQLRNNHFEVVISDMRRGTIEDEGNCFLCRMRADQLRAPIIFTVGQFDPSRGTPPYAFGITNRIDELLNLLFDALERSRG